MEELLNKTISYAQERGADFVDIRAVDYVVDYIELRDGTVHDLSSLIVRGASVRVLYKGGLGFAAVNSISYGELRKAVDQALAQARALSRAGARTRMYTVNSRRDLVKEDIMVNPRDVNIEDKVGDLVEYHKLIAGLDKRVRAVTIRYQDSFGKTYYASSEERYIEQEQCFTWLYTWASGRDGSILASARSEVGTRKGYYLFRKYDTGKLADDVVRKVRIQFKAKTPKGGVFPVVLAPEVVGVFVHEAFGHLAEADITFSGSVLEDKMNEKIASELVTIVDDPSIPDAFGTIKYDDEGVEAVPVYIVVNGVLKNVMVDRRYACMFNLKPTGNARAEDYNVPPLIRMRTTYIRPGDASLDELFEGIEFGYYIVSFRGGQANTDGTFQVGVQEAYEIVYGEIGEPVRNMSISGNTLETLKHITAVGRDFEVNYGRCGKGQTVFVSDGGPHVRVERITVGGSV